MERDQYPKEGIDNPGATEGMKIINCVNGVISADNKSVVLFFISTGYVSLLG